MSKPNQLNPLNLKGKSQTYSDFHSLNLSPAESDKFTINYERTKEELLKLKTEVKTKGQELLHLKIETAERENELYDNLRAVERIINICDNSIQKEINSFFEKKNLNENKNKEKEKEKTKNKNKEEEINNLENKNEEALSNSLTNLDKEKIEEIIENSNNNKENKKKEKTKKEHFQLEEI